MSQGNRNFKVICASKWRKFKFINVEALCLIRRERVNHLLPDITANFIASGSCKSKKIHVETLVLANLFQFQVAGEMPHVSKHTQGHWVQIDLC